MRPAPAALLIAAACAAAGAQEPPADGGDLVNFVFATQLGSGVYKSGDQLVQVYRIPGSWTLRDASERPWGLALRFAGTLGFYDFSVADILQGEIPHDVDTLTFMTGAESEVRVTPRWSLVPYADVGYGTAAAQDADSWIFDVGLESRVRIEGGGLTYLVGNRLVWAGQSAASAGLSDDFAKLDTVLDVRHPLPWSPGGRATDLGLFFENALYFDSISYFRFPRAIDLRSAEETSPDRVVAQYEFGVTFGPTEEWKVWRIPLPRIGVSFRFGSEISAIRIVLGGPF